LMVHLEQAFSAMVQGHPADQTAPIRALSV
jgi:hypothetical protein